MEHVVVTPENWTTTIVQVGSVTDLVGRINLAGG